MAKQNLTPLLIVGAAAAAYFLFKGKASAREVMTDDGAKVETDLTTDESGANIPLQVNEAEAGKENFLSKLVPVIKSEGKKIITKVRAKRAAKKAAKADKYKMLPAVTIKAKAAKKGKRLKRKRSRVKGFDNLPILY